MLATYVIGIFTDYSHHLTYKIFSVIDLVKAFQQISNDEAAIITPFRLYGYTYMTFGLKNAAPTFQRAINQITRG